MRTCVIIVLACCTKIELKQIFALFGYSFSYVGIQVLKTVLDVQ